MGLCYQRKSFTVPAATETANHQAGVESDALSPRLAPAGFPTHIVPRYDPRIEIAGPGVIVKPELGERVRYQARNGLSGRAA